MISLTERKSEDMQQEAIEIGRRLSRLCKQYRRY